MIQVYFRPKTIAEAVELLQRPQPPAIPLAGGTRLSHGVDAPTALVDLQDLPLRSLTRLGNYLHIGAMVTLQGLLEFAEIPPALKEALQHETTLHLRNMATTAGSLVTSDGRSPFTTALLALDARLTIQPGEQEISLGDWLPRRVGRKPNELITEVIISLQAHLMYEMVARSPADRPIVCVAVAKWPSGRTRVTLGGAGTAPVLAMDGPEADGAEAAVENALSQAGDAFASAAYRSQTAKIIVTRLLALGENQ